MKNPGADRGSSEKRGVDVVVEHRQCRAPEGSLQDLALIKRLAVQLHERGPRGVAELIAGLVERHPDIRADVERELLAHVRIPAEVYREMGADRFAPYLIALEGGGR